MNLARRNIKASCGSKNIRKHLFTARQFSAAGLIALLFISSAVMPAFSQTKTRKISGNSKRAVTKPLKYTNKTNSKPVKSDDEVGVPWTGDVGVTKTNDEIMAAQAVAPPSQRPPLVREREKEETQKRKEESKAKPGSRFPFIKETTNRRNGLESSDDLINMIAPQPITMNFLGATLADTGAFPPDTMGAIGPSQFVVFVNGRVRTFSKTTGVADGVINANSDVFFSSVMTPNTPGGINFTTDPNVRFDRLSGRWILTMIDVPSTSAASIGDRPNRLMIAVSDAVSNGVISAGTIWTFYFVQQDMVGLGVSNDNFLDYPSLGIDNNALYVGGNIFDASAGNFVEHSAYVIRKSSILNGGPIVTTAFRNLDTGGDEVQSPRGVDNYDPAATEGYIIGISSAAFGRLLMRRISTPGATPTISANVVINTPLATSFPITVDHLGDTGGTNGNLDALDDRLYAAHIRNGRLWTAHSMAVTAAGVASNSNAARRNAVRWYELIVPAGAGTPTFNQSGTIFDNVATVAAARQYWIPSVMVSGQGHAALGYSTAGTPFRINAATSGRLSTDTLGTTQAVNIYTASSTAYNPPSDPGPPRRWGDYSFVSLDPLDDMTMWTIQEFCSSTNSYGVQVAKLNAPPPPAVLTANPPSTLAGQTSVNIVVTGVSSGGSAFFDPGPDLAPPALPFNHISASIAPNFAPDLSVTSVTYNSPTQVTVNLNTINSSAGLKTLTITNPDGQTTSVPFTITVITAAQVSAGGRVVSLDGSGISRALVTVMDTDGVRRTAVTNPFGYFRFNSLSAGETYFFTVTAKRRIFSNATQTVNLLEDTDDLLFISDN